jgi:hypothetical protein
MDPTSIPTFASDNATVTVTPFSMHLLFGATRADGVTVPQGSVMVSIAFARFLHSLLGEAIETADRDGKDREPAVALAR